MKHKQAKGEDFSKRCRFRGTYCIWMDLNKNTECPISNSKIVNCWSQEYVIAVDREQVPRMRSHALYQREVCLPSQIPNFEIMLFCKVVHFMAHCWQELYHCILLQVQWWS